jgi:hypothetical protein
MNRENSKHLYHARLMRNNLIRIVFFWSPSTLNGSHLGFGRGGFYFLIYLIYNLINHENSTMWLV